MDKKRSGVELIADERKRQIDVEGYTAEQDKEYEDGELAMAAVCYATTEPNRIWKSGASFVPIPMDWPWQNQCWKPSPENRVRELVKAGALIAAEIDRLQSISKHS